MSTVSTATCGRSSCPWSLTLAGRNHRKVVARLEHELRAHVQACHPPKPPPGPPRPNPSIW